MTPPTPPPIDLARRRRPEGCLSDLALDRLVAGEPATRPTRAAIDAHLMTCAACAARLAELQALHAQPEPALAAGLGALQRRHSRRLLFTRASQTLLVMAAAVVLLLVPLRRRPDLEREKGAGVAVELGLVVRHSDGHVEELQPGGRVRPGDAVRFLVDSARAGYIVIMGLDAAGKVSVYVADGDRGLRIERGRRQAMPGSVILDDTPGSERVVALLCGDPPAVVSLVEVAQRKLDHADHDPRRVGDLAVLGCPEASWLMEKQSGP